MKSWAYFPADVTVVAEPIMKPIHMTNNKVFPLVTKITEATTPALSLVTLTAEHHSADLNVSLGFSLEQNI